MWLFSADGYTSIVAYDHTKDAKKSKHVEIAKNSEDPKSWLLIRARVKADLEQIEKVTGVDFHIDTDSSADYAYRGLVTKETWKKYLTMAVDAIDYDSHFKEVMSARAPKIASRHSGMMRIWSATADWQDLPPYGYSSSNAWGFDSNYGSTGYGSSYSSSSTSSYTGNYMKQMDSMIDEVRDMVEDNGKGWDRDLTATEMFYAIVDVSGEPKMIDPDLVNLADGDAWDLWCAAMDMFNSVKQSLTEDALKEAADDLGLDIGPRPDEVSYSVYDVEI